MSEELVIEGKSYVSSKRASEVTGYAQDYIGQLARAGLVDARRVGGLWYVGLESIQGHKESSATQRPVAPRTEEKRDVQEVESFVMFDGKEYISASRAAEVSGYNQDYVGQLARSGKVASRQVGNRWYVEQDALIAHKQEKDALLAAVQAESVGLQKRQAEPFARVSRESGEEWGPYLKYTAAEGDLIASKQPYEETDVPAYTGETLEENEVQEEQELRIPIKVYREEASAPTGSGAIPRRRRPGKTLYYAVFSISALAVVCVVALGALEIQRGAGRVAESNSSRNTSTLLAAVNTAFEGIVAGIEHLVTRDLYYKRSQY